MGSALTEPRRQRMLPNVHGGNRIALEAAWSYNDSPLPELDGPRPTPVGLHGRLVRRRRGGVRTSARPIDKRVQILPSSRHVRCRGRGDRRCRSSRHPAFLYETRLPRRTYIPKLDVDMERLEPTATTSQCPYKGTTTYWTVMTDDALPSRSFAWSYPTPRARVREHRQPGRLLRRTGRSHRRRSAPDPSYDTLRHTPRPPHVHTKSEVDMAGCSALSTAPKSSGSSPTPDGSTAVSCRSCTSANSAASRTKRTAATVSVNRVVTSRDRAVLRGPTSCSTGNSAALHRGARTATAAPASALLAGVGHPDVGVRRHVRRGHYAVRSPATVRTSRP